MCFWLTCTTTNRYGQGVKEQRWPWLVTAGLMLAAAVATGRSTYLYWLPCRGSMLRGIIQGYGHGKFSDECSEQMDGDNASVMPWTSDLNLVAMALLGVAWLTLVLGLRWQLRTKAVAVLPGVAAAAVALLGAAATDRYEMTPILMVLALIMEVLAVVALLWVVAWQPEVRGRQILRLVIVLWGTTAFGFVHVYIEHVIMIGFRFSTWNPPPGFGYLIFATITLSAILTVIMTLRAPRRVADDEPHQDHDSKSLTLG
jgi:hypothetical protein